MTTFNDRDKQFENKFAKDKELLFKVNARRNKLLGLWAAGKLGKQGAEAEQYAKDVVMAEFETHDDDSRDVIEKLMEDFAEAKISVSEKDIRAEMERLQPVAKKQIMGEAAF